MFKTRTWHVLQLLAFWAVIIVCSRLVFREWEDPLPVARECLVEVQVQKVFAVKRMGKYPTISGYGLIVRTDPHLSWLRGEKVSFRLYGEHPRTEVIDVQGVLERVTEENSQHFYPFFRSHGIRYRIARGFFKPLPDRKMALTFWQKQKKMFSKILFLGGQGNLQSLANVYVAMLLGEKEILSESQRNSFFCTGTMHLFAVSGVHVGMIAAVLFWILRLCRLPRWGIVVLQLLALFDYVWVVEHSPSALRALFMISFYWIAEFLSRKPSTLNSLFLSAAVILLIDPNQFWNIGFQLSYAIVIGIVCVGAPLGEYVNRKVVLFRYLPMQNYHFGHKIALYVKRTVVSLFCTSLISTIISGPLIIKYFHMFTLGGLVINILFLPLAGVVVSLGVFSILFGLISCTFVSKTINFVAYSGIWVMDRSADLFTRMTMTYWKWNVTNTRVLDVLTIALLVGCVIFKIRFSAWLRKHSTSQDDDRSQ